MRGASIAQAQFLGAHLCTTAQAQSHLAKAGIGGLVLSRAIDVGNMERVELQYVTAHGRRMTHKHPRRTGKFK